MAGADADKVAEARKVPLKTRQHAQFNDSLEEKKYQDPLRHQRLHAKEVEWQKEHLAIGHSDTHPMVVPKD